MSNGIPTVAQIKARLDDIETCIRQADAVDNNDLNFLLDQHKAEVERLHEQVKGVACEVCWTTSWTPIEKVEDAVGVNTKKHGETLTRCEHCWREKVYSEKLTQAEALLVALPDGAVDTLKKWYAEKKRAEQAEAKCRELTNRLLAESASAREAEARCRELGERLNGVQNGAGPVLLDP